MIDNFFFVDGCMKTLKHNGIKKIRIEFYSLKLPLFYYEEKNSNIMSNDVMMAINIIIIIFSSYSP